MEITINDCGFRCPCNCGMIMRADQIIGMLHVLSISEKLKLREMILNAIKHECATHPTCASCRQREGFLDPAKLERTPGDF